MVKKKELSLVISDLCNGQFFVLFDFDGEIIEGLVNSEFIPEDYQELTYDELAEHFENWFEIITDKNESNNELKKELKEKQIINEIVNCKYLIQKENLFYRLNESVSLPTEIVSAYINATDETVEKLDNFWYWTMKAEPQIREMLYRWLSKDTWAVTEEGMLLVYRNVIVHKDNSEYAEFVTEHYNKVKNVWKKSPKNYFVNRGEVLSLTTQTTSLNLFDEFNNLDSEVVYTHEYNSDDRLYYRLGQETTLDKSKCDTSESTCSSGIHSMSKKYLEDQGQSYFGKVTIACLVNPCHITSCPTEGSYNKMRSCAIYPVCVVGWEYGLIVEPDLDIVESASKKYNEMSNIDLESFVNETYEDINPKFIGVKKEVVREVILF